MVKVSWRIGQKSLIHRSLYSKILLSRLIYWPYFRGHMIERDSKLEFLTANDIWTGTLGTLFPDSDNVEDSPWIPDRPVRFIDIGCGNGLLVYLLVKEGHIGKGIDIRRRNIWSRFQGRWIQRLFSNLIKFHVYWRSKEFLRNRKKELNWSRKQSSQRIILKMSIGFWEITLTN